MIRESFSGAMQSCLLTECRATWALGPFVECTGGEGGGDILHQSVDRYCMPKHDITNLFLELQLAK